MTEPRARPLGCSTGCFQFCRSAETERELKSALRLNDGDYWIVAGGIARQVGSSYEVERSAEIATVHRDLAEPLVFEIVAGFAVAAAFEVEQRQHCREYLKTT